jgi:hypothetical protein
MTAQLIGAWTSPGRGALEVAPELRRRLTTELGLDGLREVQGDHYWLAGAASLAHGGGAVATIGFVALDRGRHADRTAQLGELASGAVTLEGHYALARVEPRGQLVLTRGASGGERLYYAEVNGTIWFCSSLRPLLCHPAIERRVDVEVLRELLLNGHPVFGQRTAIAGIEEVKPGHDARFGAGLSGNQRWTRDDFLRSPEGDLPALARGFRDNLRRAVELAIGDERPVALALSGGIDSSAIAAAAVDVVEASQIRAYSWEFDDPTHPKETHYARMVSRQLGITHHDVFDIDASRFLAAIPEHLWRSESAVHWPKAFLLVAGRELMERGHGRYLTGFGIGSHMAYLQELTRMLRRLPSARWLPRLWRQARFERAGWPHLLERLHPGLEPPHPRLYPMLAEVLCREGLIADHRTMFPHQIESLLRTQPRTTDAGGEGLAERLQKQAFSHLVSCIDVTRSEKASREIGIHRISPAHFSMCLPYAYFPISPPPPFTSKQRRDRPGKLLLKQAYRGTLPDEVLFRVKDWADAVVSPNWRRRARVNMLRALPHFPGDMAQYDPTLPSTIEWWEPRSIQANCLSQRLWLELFVDQAPRAAPPTWAELWKLPEQEGPPDHQAFVPI